MKSAILSVLNESSVCRQIVTFLIDNEASMDSVKGIATWWVHCDQLAAQVALDQLIACGVVSVRTLTSGPIYGLTQDPEIRSLLQDNLTEPLVELRATT